MTDGKTTAPVFDSTDAGSGKTRVVMGSRMTSSRLIGALFLAGFAVYGVGFGLVSSVVGTPDVLVAMSAHQTTLVLGAFLMLLNTVVEVGKAAWGVLGYAIHMAGAIAEIFGIPISLMFLIPGMLFELALPLWLFIKGFGAEAYAGRAEVVMTPTIRPAPAMR